MQRDQLLHHIEPYPQAADRQRRGNGLLERCVYPETPVRIEYRLTEKGKALTPVIDAIQQWGSEWLTTSPASAQA